jgi:hypothetical protein
MSTGTTQGSGSSSGSASGTSPSGGGSGGAALADAGTAGSSDASTPNKILIYHATTGFRHASIPAAASAIAQAAMGAGLSVVISPPNPATDSNPVPADFAPGALAPYGAVVLLANSGYALGTPGIMQIQTLVDFVNAGGGLVGIEDATHCYDDSFPPAVPEYISLLGADFNGHSGFGPGTCETMGSHPSIDLLPKTFAITDEVYYFSKMNTDLQVVLQCANPGAAPRPISWVRTQGAGRVFYTALGHADPSWTTGPLVPDHVLPGLLWTMHR